MKKLLLICAVILAMAAGAFAEEKPANEAFYLFGSFNGWQPATVTNQSKFPYKLTDEDGDGVYTGTFELPEGTLEFKLLSEPLQKIGTWEEENTWGVYELLPMPLFNRKTQVNFDYRSIADHGRNGASKISNWLGGTLTISVEWEEWGESWIPLVTLYAPGQPARPGMPEVYIFGDFNNWQIPTADSDNGAIKFNDYSFDKNNFYNEVGEYITIDKTQDYKFGICKFDRSNNSISYFFPESNPPFTLYSTESEYASMTFPGDWSEVFDDKFCTLDLKDYEGGECGVSLQELLRTIKPTLRIWGGTKTIITPPDLLYAIIALDGQKWIKPCHYLLPGYFSVGSYITDEIFSGKEVSIIYSTEDSLDPSPESCYGLPENVNPQWIMSYLNTNKMFPLVKGGKPFSYTFPKEGRMWAAIDFKTSVATMSIDVIGAITSEKLYVCGNVMTAPDGKMNGFLAPSQANQDIYDEYFQLENCGDYFQRTFYIPEKENADPYYYPDNLPQFRFFTELLGWTYEASLGSALADFYCEPISLSDGPVDCDIVEQGLGNWGVMDSDMTWTGNWVTMTVFRETGKLRLEITGSGIVDMTTDDETSGEQSESWFNLQGIRVDRPESGLYIHVTNGKSRLELIK